MCDRPKPTLYEHIWGLLRGMNDPNPTEAASWERVRGWLYKVIGGRNQGIMCFVPDAPERTRDDGQAEPNPSAEHQKSTPDESYTMTIERRAGLWLVTGSMHKGLVVRGHTMTEALSRVEGSWADLRNAEEELARAKQ